MTRRTTAIVGLLLLGCSDSTGAEASSDGTEETGLGDETAEDETAEDDDGTTGSEGTESDTTGEDPGEPIPVLGNGTHSLDEVDMTIISSPSDGLNFPTDAEFKPGTQQLWVTNRADFSVCVYDLAGGTVSKYSSPGGNGSHFLAKPAALAFGDNGNFATAQQEAGITQPGDPADGSFMGPTLWTSNLPGFEGGHNSHLDMLHNSPLASGIAYDEANSFWVYDGFHGSLSYYKFNADHGLGGTDHSDGEIFRYADGELGYVNSIPSHVAWDRDTSYLYAADTENRRIVRLDPTIATTGSQIFPNYDGGNQQFMQGAELITLIDGTDLLAPAMMGPSGLELHEGLLFVSDPFAGVIYGFDTDGNLLDWLETGLPAGSLLGFAFDAEGSIYVADAFANQIHKIAAK